MVVSALLREVRPRYSPNHHTFRHASMNETARTLTLRKKGSRKPQISAPKQISGPTSTKAAGEKLLDVRRERPGQSETSGKFILYCIIGIKFSDELVRVEVNVDKVSLAGAFMVVAEICRVILSTISENPGVAMFALDSRTLTRCSGSKIFSETLSLTVRDQQI